MTHDPVALALKEFHTALHALVKMVEAHQAGGADAEAVIKTREAAAAKYDAWRVALKAHEKGK